MSRLIDADALREDVKGLHMSVTGLRAGKGVLAEYAKQYRNSLDRLIDEAPTIDAVPVVHGRWEKRKDTFYCTNCGYGIDDYEFDPDDDLFCKKCGAKMDLEVDGDG